MSGELKPCLCGQKNDAHHMLVVDECDFDGFYVKCDSCGHCGPVGYPGDEYDACDASDCDKANDEARSKAISMWNELWDGRERLRAELARKDEEIKAAEEFSDALIHSRACMASVGTIQSAILKGCEFPVTQEVEKKIAEYLAEAKIADQVVNAARARLAEVRGEGKSVTPPAIELPETQPTVWSRNLFRRRGKVRVSLRQLGEATGILPSRLSELEQGFPHVPTEDEIRLINDFFRPLEVTQ